MTALKQSATSQRRQPSIAAVLLIAAIAVALLAVLLVRQRSTTKPAHEYQFAVFGTYAKLTFWGPEALARKGAKQIEEALKELNDRINVFDEHSELSQLNQAAASGEVHCSPQLWDMLRVARRAHRETGGAFDVTIGPLMKLWGFYARRQTYPDEPEVAAAHALVGLDKVFFNDQEHTVRFSEPGMYLDFGGLAKGYALDLAAEIAGRAGLTCGMIDLGGNIYCLPVPPPGQEAYRVGIRDPDASDRLLSAERLLDQAIATSGNYENSLFLQGRFVHHIVNPATGYPVATTASVTVITPSGTASDIYSTAIFVRGVSLAEDFCRDHPRSQVIILRKDQDGERTVLRFPPPDIP
jgi:thiamine biosynthesis lipoprotein